MNIYLPSPNDNSCLRHCVYVVDCVQKKKKISQYRHKYISNTINSVYNILIIKLMFIRDEL